MSLSRYANSCQIDPLVVIAAGTLTMVNLRRPGEFPSLNNIVEITSITIRALNLSELNAFEFGGSFPS
ncbi:hypothetical protein F9C07_1063 [Aspergillus flavus]|uniref:Uncharacterized protein n=1 Tax=Aspergillus flavus (strain ATCC 200026 / FGSC A1120 / IAM 13836 / NRRL 3357 / JCM 12722 / SRRC 167) TaxID=332952 RepID=A0A7U2MQM8_ASPFN|nr:hypothetical protein F9C07_1063 [Aspergillus flavus]